MLREFKEFALRGNVVDLSVGVIIGGAFGRIVTSLVSDIIMPPMGLLIGGMDFTNLFVDLSGRHSPTLAAAKESGAATLNFGVFLNTLLDFVIVAAAMFILVRQVNRLMRKPPAAGAEPAVRECPRCFSIVPARATRCSHCTADIPATA